MQVQKLPIPLQGVNEFAPASAQPPLTTPYAVNCRAINPANGKMQLCQRAGTSLFNTAQVANAPVDLLASVMRHNPAATYTEKSGSTSTTAPWRSDIEWSVTVPYDDDVTLPPVGQTSGHHSAYAIDVDELGNVYTLADIYGQFCKYSTDGRLVWVHSVDADYDGIIPDTGAISTDTVNLIMKSIRYDGAGNLYVSGNQDDGTNYYGFIIKYRLETDGPKILWGLRFSDHGGLVDFRVRKNWAYAVFNINTPAVAVRRIAGIDTRTPRVLWTRALPTANAIQASSIDIGPNGRCYVACFRQEDSTDGLDDFDGIMYYVEPDNRTTANSGFVSGCGKGIIINQENGYVYSHGISISSTDLNTVTRFAPELGTASTDDFLQATHDQSEFLAGTASMDIDRNGDIYIALDASAASGVFNLLKLGADLSTKWKTAMFEDSTNSTVDQDLFAVRCHPDYPPKQYTASVDATSAADPTSNDGTEVSVGAEFIYVGTSTAVATFRTSLHKIRVTDVEVTTGSPRTLAKVAGCGGTLYVSHDGSGDTTGTTKWHTVTRDADVAANYLQTTNASSTDVTKQWVRSVTSFGKLYILTGDKYLFYRPEVGNYGTIYKWESENGSLPQRAKLIAIWNGRMVLARTDGEPHNWFMSKQGDFHDWDYFPFPTTATQAVAGNNSEAGLCPDVITALVPWSDDLLFFGCDHSIYRMTGDPMAGGRLDLVSDSIGIAFGSSWCKGDDGTVYFFGSRGGIYAMPPGGQPTRISTVSIDERLADLDLSTYEPTMVWNDREKGLHVFIIDRTAVLAGTDNPLHYYFDSLNNGWWFDKFGLYGSGPQYIEPHSVAVFDGDQAGDRVLAIGGRDGYVRAWNVDRTADIDSAGVDVPIASECYLGPLVLGGVGREWRMTGVRGVLDDGVDMSVNYEFYTADSPNFDDKVKADAFSNLRTFFSGRNPPTLDRARGNTMWMRLFDDAGTAHWAVESIDINAEIGGRARVRS